MGRPKGSKNKTNEKSTTKPKKRLPKKKCMACGEEKSIASFYTSYNDFHKDGFLPMCKECIQNECYDKEKDQIDLLKFKNVLRQLDKPYITKIFESAISEYNKIYGGKLCGEGNKKKIIGKYFKNINTLQQYTTLTWNQGVELEELVNVDENVLKKIEEPYMNQENKDKVIYSLNDDFEVTEEMLQLFGVGFKKSEYEAMWNKYIFLSKNYNDVTSLHTEALITYIKYKVKEEFSVIRGTVDEAKKWGELARGAAADAKITPKQLSQGDLQGGINSFSELFQAVEQAEDVIPILPQFKYRPNDAIDFNIWCIINYLRNLEGKPLCDYEDIYQFYDARKQEYIDQYGDPYGIFNNDTTELNRENVKRFITLPSDYIIEEPEETEELGEIDEG